MQFPSLFQGGRRELDKNNCGGQEVFNRPGSCGKEFGISIGLKRIVMLSTTIRWPYVMQQKPYGVQGEVWREK